MTTVDPNFSEDENREARRQRLFTRINKADRWFTVLGLAWITPVLKAAAGDNPSAQAKEIWKLLAVPLLVGDVLSKQAPGLVVEVEPGVGHGAELHELDEVRTHRGRCLEHGQ